MTATTRKLDFIVWTDPYGELEINEAKLNKAIKRENQNVQDYLSTVPQTRLNAWRKSFANLPEAYPPYYSFDWNDVKIYVCEHNRYIPNFTLKLKDGKTLNLKGVISFGTTPTKFWTITDKSDGKEQLTLSIYSSDLKLVQELEDVGESAEAQDESIYYLGAEDILWFNKVYILKDGKPKMIYKESEPKFSLQLYMPKNQDLVFVLRKSAIYQQLGIIRGEKIQWLYGNLFGRKIPLNESSVFRDSFFYFGDEKINYPDDQHILSGYHKDGQTYCVFSKDATQSLYMYNHSSNSWHTIMAPQVCEIKQSPYQDLFIVGYPNRPDEVYDEKGQRTFTSIGPSFNIESGSSPVPWFIIQPKQVPKGVVVCGYGSYGMHVKKYQQRLWLPWVQQGYSIAILCVRGGGENGDLWWNMGRGPENLKNRVTDFVTGVRYIKDKYGFTKNNTVIYGRSAGGFLVAAATYHLMDEIAVTYAAKPYTDLLLTTTNPKARQALQESDEFGFVEDDPVGFSELAMISPYETAPESPNKNPAILVTTGTNDSEVPTAMPVRYALRLHDLGWKNIFCRVAINEGHFTEQSGEQGEAEDAAIIESFLTKGD